MTSVSVTERGTVLSMRARIAAQVALNTLGDCAKARIVAFPSLEKMRASERVVTLAPTTSGLFVDPEM
jgi:hypothetical protein